MANEAPERIPRWLRAAFVAHCRSVQGGEQGFPPAFQQQPLVFFRTDAVSRVVIRGIGRCATQRGRSTAGLSCSSAMCSPVRVRRRYEADQLVQRVAVIATLRAAPAIDTYAKV
jgi:hypothetical protein